MDNVITVSCEKVETPGNLPTFVEIDATHLPSMLFVEMAFGGDRGNGVIKRLRWAVLDTSVPRFDSVGRARRSRQTIRARHYGVSGSSECGKGRGRALRGVAFRNGSLGDGRAEDLCARSQSKCNRRRQAPSRSISVLTEIPFHETIHHSTGDQRRPDARPPGAVRGSAALFNCLGRLRSAVSVLVRAPQTQWPS